MTQADILTRWGLRGAVNAGFWESQDKALWAYCGVSISDQGEMGYDASKAVPPYGEATSTFPIDQAARLNAGMALVRKGLLVHPSIMPFPSDPYLVFQLLGLGGVPYMNNLGGPDAPRNEPLGPPYPPGTFPTIVIDEGNPEATLAMLSEFYPPLAPPAPPVPPDKALVGRALGGGLFAAGPGAIGPSSFGPPATVLDGGIYEQDGSPLPGSQFYVAHVGYGMMGPSIYFTLKT